MRVETAKGPDVIVTGLQLNWLRRHCSDKHPEFPPRSSLTITDRNGIILIRLPNWEREGTPLSRYPLIAESAKGGTCRSTAENTADGVARYLGFVAPGERPAKGLSVGFGIPQDTVLANIRAAAVRSHILLGGIALLTVVAAAMSGHFFIRRPTLELLSAIGHWRKGELAARTKPGALPAEFAQLGAAFNAMASDLEAPLDLGVWHESGWIYCEAARRRAWDHVGGRRSGDCGDVPPGHAAGFCPRYSSDCGWAGQGRRCSSRRAERNVSQFGLSFYDRSLLRQVQWWARRICPCICSDAKRSVPPALQALRRRL